MIYIPLGVAIVCFILYALDRRSKNEKIDWFTAGKFTLFGGLLSAGIVYVLKSETLEIVIPTEVPIVEEMFVGVPTF
jgi:hypothetical protein